MCFVRKCLFIIAIVVVSLYSCTKHDDRCEVSEEESFSIDTELNTTSSYFIIFGDIQEYTSNENYLNFYNASLNWVFEQKNKGAIFTNIIQVGDITQNNTPTQWEAFSNTSKLVTDILPFFVCVGNHDYSWNEKSMIENRKSTLINEFAHFPLTDSSIIEYYSSNSLENYVARLSDELDLKLLVLEFGPRLEVVEWAKRYVEMHSKDNFLLLTHAWLRGNGERISIGSNIDQQFAGYSSYCTPEDIWNYLVKPNDNIRCVLCGHDGFSANLFSVNDVGRSVPQILFNLQYQNNGGNALVQLWEFPSNSKSVKIGVYDTINRCWYLPETTFLTFHI